jgi:hypothetical protein
MSKGEPLSTLQMLLFATFLMAMLPIVLLLVALYLLAGILLHLAIWCVWCTRGHDVLLVYSDSPIWQAYFEEQLVPRLGRRAVVLNWSQRRLWPLTLAVTAFRFFGGNREFNPLAIVFRPFRLTKRFRYYKPFCEFKHGKPEAVDELTAQLLALLDGPRAPSA